MQADLFHDETPRPLALAGADIRYIPRIALGIDPSDLLVLLRESVQWQQEEIVVWGKKHLQPRLIAWFGDHGAGYRYSGISLKPSPWTPLLLKIRTAVEDASTSEYNSVLLNYYRDNRDSMGFHSDDEPELGLRPTIASLSVGAVRTLVFKSKHHRPPVTRRFPLQSGSLLVMAGETQRNWKHGIEKEARISGPRINLTFRKIVPAPG